MSPCKNRSVRVAIIKKKHCLEVYFTFIIPFPIELQERQPRKVET